MSEVVSVKLDRYDPGSYARSPANYWNVQFADGEVVTIRDGERIIVCGLIYQPGECRSEYGAAALAAFTVRPGTVH